MHIEVAGEAFGKTVTRYGQRPFLGLNVFIGYDQSSLVAAQFNIVSRHVAEQSD